MYSPCAVPCVGIPALASFAFCAVPSVDADDSKDAPYWSPEVVVGSSYAVPRADDAIPRADDAIVPYNPDEEEWRNFDPFGRKSLAKVDDTLDNKPYPYKYAHWDRYEFSLIDSNRHISDDMEIHYSQGFERRMMRNDVVQRRLQTTGRMTPREEANARVEALRIRLENAETLDSQVVELLSRLQKAHEANAETQAVILELKQLQYQLNATQNALLEKSSAAEVADKARGIVHKLKIAEKELAKRQNEVRELTKKLETFTFHPGIDAVFDLPYEDRERFNEKLLEFAASTHIDLSSEPWACDAQGVALKGAAELAALDKSRFPLKFKFKVEKEWQVADRYRIYEDRMIGQPARPDDDLAPRVGL